MFVLNLLIYCLIIFTIYVMVFRLCKKWRPFLGSQHIKSRFLILACEGKCYLPRGLEQLCPAGCWWDPDVKGEDSVRGPPEGVCLKQGPCYWAPDLGYCTGGIGLCGQGEDPLVNW